jgi:hypothetical protein
LTIAIGPVSHIGAATLQGGHIGGAVHEPLIGIIIAVRIFPRHVAIILLNDYGDRESEFRHEILLLRLGIQHRKAVLDALV